MKRSDALKLIEYEFKEFGNHPNKTNEDLANVYAQILLNMLERTYMDPKPYVENGAIFRKWELEDE